MAISAYAELQAALTNWLHRDNLSSRIPEFIAMGEAYLNRKLRVADMEASSTITPSTSVRYVALPTGFMEPLSFTNEYGEPLTAVDPESLERLAYGIGATRPYYYRISSRIDFEAVADTTYSYTLRYLKRLDLATDLTNAVLTNHPDCYLYASLMQSAPFLKDDARIMTWKSLMDDAVKAANSQSVKSLQLLQTEVFSNIRSNILRG